MSRILDLDSWKRRQHYEFFKNYDLPFFNVTADLDVTELRRLCKNEGGPSFFAASLFLSLEAAQGVEGVLHEADFPAGARPIANSRGTAPGIWPGGGSVHCGLEVIQVISHAIGSFDGSDRGLVSPADCPKAISLFHHVVDHLLWKRNAWGRRSTGRTASSVIATTTVSHKSRIRLI